MSAPGSSNRQAVGLAPTDRERIMSWIQTARPEELSRMMQQTGIALHTNEDVEEAATPDSEDAPSPLGRPTVKRKLALKCSTQRYAAKTKKAAIKTVNSRNAWPAMSPPMASTSQAVQGEFFQPTESSGMFNKTLPVMSSPPLFSFQQAPSDTGSVSREQPGPSIQQAGDIQKIWILGHSYVHWAELRAQIRKGAANLYLSDKKYKVIWNGIRGMRWEKLFQTLTVMLKTWGYPKVIVIHLGGNDIGFIKTIQLIKSIKQDLCQISLFMPDVYLIWSEIVPRLCWQSQLLKPLEKCRRKINHSIAKFAGKLNITVYRHHELENGFEGLFREDKVHLSEIGLDIFNVGLQNAVEKALFCGGGPSPS
ncbi:uncharacterized protein LOC121397678 [Xenopus laevis]|uniref:Uncharacterized protein LOC121397678 n=1 Tax=Xenopus laevis TaxID=8355 RepID=A0A8J1LML3_XENLA|nr:uncharacterized protein LOC121397678 [Xenopus laevis]